MDKRKKGKKEISIPRGSKKLHIDGKIWYWKYTCYAGECLCSTLIILCMETGKKYKVKDYAFKGWSSYDVERTKHKSPGCFQILPSEVKEYIEENILGK